jgi:hypothetical protein
MVVSRRSFMKRGGLLVLATGVSLGSADRIFGSETHVEYSDPKEGDSPQTDDTPVAFDYAKATFLPHVGTIFRIYYPNSSKAVTTTLVSISDLGPVPDRTERGRECFVLKFRGTETLRQNTYLIEHAVLGRFDLFLTPAGKNKQGVYHEAVINRLNA